MRAILGLGHQRALHWVTRSVIQRRIHLDASVGTSKSTLSHTPVLLQEVLKYFDGHKLGVLLDCTLGAAGHTSALIQGHPVIPQLLLYE